jgi:hypothetical protein
MCSPSVIPAHVGIQLFTLLVPPELSCMPACAGMTLESKAFQPSRKNH